VHRHFARAATRRFSSELTFRFPMEFVPYPLNGSISWGMGMGRRRLPAPAEFWAAIQAGSCRWSLRDTSVAHTTDEASFRRTLAYTHLLLVAGSHPAVCRRMSNNVALWRTVADDVTGTPNTPAVHIIRMTTLLRLFGANFFDPAPGNTVGPDIMARWMHHIELDAHLTATRGWHLLRLASHSRNYGAAVAALRLGRIRRAGCGVLRPGFNHLRQGWRKDRGTLFSVGFNRLIHTLLLVWSKAGMPPELAHLVAGLVDPDSGPFDEGLRVNYRKFQQNCNDVGGCLRH